MATVDKVKTLFVVLFLGAILLPIAMNNMSEPLGTYENETIGTADGSGILTANVSNPPIDTEDDRFNVTVWANSTELTGGGTDYSIQDAEDGTIAVDSADAANDTIKVSYKMDMEVMDTVWYYIPVVGLVAVIMAVLKRYT